eukprot:GHVO01037370.1.p2 GENE.GHVO01037370.1~~GHVO01037370.1.p2  ORF type:complete len:152 (-),score=14.69 GHVO01037370.1:77-532(-)
MIESVSQLFLICKLDERSIDTSIVIGVCDAVIKALALRHKSAFQDHATFFISLILFGRKLVNPSEFSFAIFARDVANHVASCQHDAILDFAELEIGDFVEEERATSCSGEASGDELSAVCQGNIATGAGEEAGTTEVLEEDSTHDAVVKHR